MKNLVYILLPVFLGSFLQTYADDDEVYYQDIRLKRIEIPFYSFAEFTPQVALRMEYAKFEISNEEEWREVSVRNIPYEVDLVFTKYPKNLKRWRTNYDELVNDRLRALLDMDSSFRHPSVKWNMVLQTKPESEEEAKQYFHGFVIKYKPRRLRVIEEVKSPAQLKALIAGRATIKDSTVIKVLDRHPQWKNMLVVTDWTGSMYKHGAQLALWHKRLLLREPDRVKHFVFFNDGNRKKSWQKTAGKTGGVYRAKSNDLEEIVETMEYVMRKGNGGDPPENDLEALLTGIQYLTDWDELILIADNKSEVRDIELLGKIDRPVRVILCDVKGKVHPHYQSIAEKTGGSLHTLRKDVKF